MKEIIGNLLDLTEGAIVHQVNCRGAIGGLAHALHDKYHRAFVDYFLLCDKYGAKNLGSVHEGHASGLLSIVHVFGQIEPGAHTDMTAVKTALESMYGRPLLTPIYAPYKMGCGIGGGDWSRYLAALVEAFPDIIIVKRPEDAR